MEAREGTTKSFWITVFCSTQLVYIIATTISSIWTCAAHMYSARGPFWTRYGSTHTNVFNGLQLGNDETYSGTHLVISNDYLPPSRFLLKGTRAPGDVITSPGASKRVVMPGVGHTRGWPVGGDAQEEPHPPPRPGYIVDYTHSRGRGGSTARRRGGSKCASSYCEPRGRSPKGGLLHPI